MTTPVYCDMQRYEDIIRGKLAQTELEHRVEIVFAVESGSRAWGFPSVDSDYDVRFVYRRKPEDYLTLVKKPEHIGKSVKGAFYDITGWDIGKALLLGLKSNATLLEWLQSPLRYRWSSEAEDILSCLTRISDRKPLVYNYYNLARSSLEEVDKTPNLKKYLYGVRAALCLRYMRMYQGIPPMNLHRLLEGAELSAQTMEVIARAVAKKSSGREADSNERIPELDNFLELEVSKASESNPQKTQVVEDAKLLAQAELIYKKIVGFER